MRAGRERHRGRLPAAPLGDGHGHRRPPPPAALGRGRGRHRDARPRRDLAARATTMASAFHADASSSTRSTRPRELVLGASVGVRLAKASRPPRLRVGEGMTGWAARERMPVAIPRDAQLDPRFRHLGRARRGLAGVDPGRAGPGARAARRRPQRPHLGGARVRRLRGRAVATIAAQVGQAIENASSGALPPADRRARGADRARRTLPRRSTSTRRSTRLSDAAEAATPTSAPSRSPSAPGAPPEVAYRSSDAGPPDEALAAAAATGPARAPACWPCRSRPAAARSARSSAPAPRGQPFTRAERALLRSIAPRPPPASPARAARCAACSPRRSTTGSRTTCRPWRRSCGSPPAGDATRTGACATRVSRRARRSPRCTTC